MAAVIAGGCASPASPPLRVGWVRIEALVALHPAYHQLAVLDQWVQSARTAAKEAPLEVPSSTSRAFAPAWGAELQPPQVEAALDRVKQVTGEELARIAADLEARAQEEIARRTREAERESQAQTAGRRTEIVQALASERRQVLLAARPQVGNLRLQVANLEAQASEPRIMPEQKAQMQARLQELRRELADALAQQSSHLDALQRRYDAQLAALDRAAAQQAAREVAEFRERLHKELEADIARERARLAAPLAAAAHEMTLGLELPQAEPAVVALGVPGQEVARTASALRRRRASWSSGIKRGAKDLSALRQQLRESIIRDTRTTAETLARANHWRLEWTKPVRGGTKDVTPQAQKWLRDYWRA